MYKPSKQEKHIEKEYNKYCAWVYQYAEDTFDAVILPYLKKNGLIFVAGNGTFYIEATVKTSANYMLEKCYLGTPAVDADKLPKRIQAILDSEVLGMENNLGSLMPDYKE